jgi:pectate lyase
MGGAPTGGALSAGTAPTEGATGGGGSLPTGGGSGGTALIGGTGGAGGNAGGTGDRGTGGNAGGTGDRGTGGNAGGTGDRGTGGNAGGTGDRGTGGNVGSAGDRATGGSGGIADGTGGVTDGAGGDSGGTGGDTGGSGGGLQPDLGQPIGFATLNGGTTGGEEGEVVTATSYSELQSYAESSTPYTIMVEGTISNGSGGGQIDVRSNKSILGVGSDAFLSGVGLNIASANNIIVRNLRATLVGTNSPTSVNGGDIISIHRTSKNIWIDHCELFSEDPATQTDIDKYDGLIDIKHQTGFITISYCHLHDHHKGGLVGSSDDDLHDDRKVTFHHNYYEDVRLRIPMYRGSTGHFFNNYIVGARDATEIRTGTCVRVERNYYESLHYSIYTPTDARGSTERIENIEVERADRAYPDDCTADIPYSYSEVLTTNTADIPTLVPQLAGVGRI